MPSRGHIAGSLSAALAVTLLFLLWIGWPGFLAVGAGAVFGVAFLVVATSLGVDPRAADEAWRRHARDLNPARGDTAESEAGPGQEPPAQPRMPASGDEVAHGRTPR